MTPALASRRAVIGMVRGLGFLGVLAVALLGGQWSTTWPQVVAVGVLALVGTVANSPPRVRDAVVLAEAGIIAVIVAASPDDAEPSLVYLLVPPIIAAMTLGVSGLGAAVAIAALSYVVTSVLGDSDYLPSGLVELTVWLAASIAIGLAALLARHWRERRAPADADYHAARRLLTSLRDVARALPGGLEETELARSTLDRLADVLPHTRAAVYLRGSGGRLHPVAEDPEGQATWSPTIDRGTWGEVWESGSAVQRLGALDGPEWGTDQACAVLPLRLGGSVIGLVGVERSGGLWPIADLAAAQTWADDAALRLDTARLFEEVRDLATTQERQRLSREIHDGIAQDIAGLGLLVDDALSHTDDPSTRGDLTRIRTELTRMVTDLRLSIYDLRADVGAGIGEALGAFVRSVGTDAGLTVHLVLDEDDSRLPAGVAAEILRIAQEAVTNARRHARARTLWVTYRVESGSAFLRVADDGRGLHATSPRSDSFGLTIMRERATRIGGMLTVRERGQGGTVVELSVAAASTAGTMAHERAPQGGRLDGTVGKLDGTVGKLDGTVGKED